MTSTRVLSSIVFFAVFLVGLFAPGFGWIPTAIAAAAAWMGAREFVRLGPTRPPAAQAALAEIAAVALVLDAHFASLHHAVAIVGLLVVLTIGAGVWIERPDVASLAGRVVAAPLYAALPLALIVNLIENPPVEGAGAYYVLFLIFVTWSSDIGAYFVGRRFGRRKLAPRLSPGKTIEGTAGGLALTFVVAIGLKLGWGAMGALFSWLDVIALAALFGVVGPIGDLAESRLKRAAGVKDSGQTMTGHGGMLDIIDSLLFATIVYAIYLALRSPAAGAS
jgi:phosphatidate cytidylyltransferase